MAIAASDIKFKFSEKVSGNGNTTAGNAAGSLGKISLLRRLRTILSITCLMT